MSLLGVAIYTPLLKGIIQCPKNAKFLDDIITNLRSSYSDLVDQ